MLAELFHMPTTIWAKTPYIKDFVTELKDEIPKDYRYWDSSEKAWVVSYAYEKVLLALCQKHFDKVIQYGRKGYSVPKQSSPKYKTLFLLPNAPKEVVMAAYRALSFKYHPDVNKDPDATEKMKEINIARDKIMGKR